MESKQVGLLLKVVMLSILAFDRGNCNTQDMGKVVTGVKDSESSLHRDSRSVHRSQRSATNETQTNEAVDNHNRVRRLVGASDAEKMTWNDDLAILADGWAQKCNFSHGQPYPIPSTLPYEQLGQNLYAKQLTYINITDAVQEWFNEEQWYNYDNMTCQSGQQCGHYTQVVWATSREIGCAYQFCETLHNSTVTDAYFLVCNYGPPGNVVGEKPFQIGTGCSKCASGSWWCNQGLCDQTCTTTYNESTCGCAPVCLNFGSVNSANCSCRCAPGWNGVDCSVVCTDYDSRCNRQQQGQETLPPYFCDFKNYTGAYVNQQCPKMCNHCQAAAAVGGGGNSNYYTSTKSSLLTMLLVWLCLLLLNGSRSN